MSRRYGWMSYIKCRNAMSTCADTCDGGTRGVASRGGGGYTFRVHKKGGDGD